MAPAQSASIRFVVGMAQMFGAVAGVVLLILTGVSVATLVVVGMTTALSLTSRIVYGRRRGGQDTGFRTRA